MDIRKHHLQQAVEQRIINPQQADALWALWRQQNSHVPQFGFTHVLYYLGGLLAIGAMSLFMNLGWEAFGGTAIVVLCLLYGMAGITLTEYFRKRSLHIPAGICATFVVVLVPLAVYGLQQALGFWPDDTMVYRDYHHWIDWRWLMMELATLAAAAVMLWRYRYPFLVMPVAVTLWYMSMDIADWIFYGHNGVFDWTLKQQVSALFGAVMILLAFWVDFRNQSGRDYPFWLYLFGVITFWGGLSFMESDSEWNKFIYFLLNMGMVFTGVLIRRRVFAVFGALGMFGYCWHLADKIFKDSWLFPISLTLIGLLIVCIGVWWQKNEAVYTQKLQNKMPQAVRRFLQRKFQ